MPTPFNIYDRKNQYLPCPQCKSTFGMGILCMSNVTFVMCNMCGFQGPKIETSIPSQEIDKQAFDAWNNLKREE